MDYKVGDKVKVKEWDELREEYGLDGSGMRKFMGKVVTIEDVLDDEDKEEVYYTLKEDKLKYYWEGRMFSPVEVEQGDVEQGDVGSFDEITRPKHYADKGIEVIEYIQDTLDFLEITGYEAYCLGNVLKYVSRYTKKDNPVKDLGKALYYLQEVYGLNVEKEGK